VATSIELLTSDAARWFGSFLDPWCRGLCGVALGARLSSRRDQAIRRLGFIAKQLHCFYSTMLSLTIKIRVHSEIRNKISMISQDAWAQLCEDSKSRPIEAREHISNLRGSEFKKIVEYDNLIFLNELFPEYIKMLDLFRENLSLVDPDTQEYYPTLVEFTEKWNRWLSKSLPVEVLKVLERNETNLEPFFIHLEQKQSTLRRRLMDGKI